MTQAGRPAAVLELPARGFTCEISKEDAASEWTVEVLRAGRVVCRAQAPTGTHAIRIRRTGSAWEAETF